MNLYTTKTAELRKMAEKQKIKGYEEMERKELIETLKPKSEKKPEESKKPEKVEEKEEEKDEVSETSEELEEKEEETSFGIDESRTAVGSRAEVMKDKLSKQRKVTILIPLGKDDKPGTTTPVTLNGYRLNIQHGVYVEVPEQIARIIMKSQKQTMKALEGISPKTGKSTRLDGTETEFEN